MITTFQQYKLNESFDYNDLYDKIKSAILSNPEAVKKLTENEEFNNEIIDLFGGKSEEEIKKEIFSHKFDINEGNVFASVKNIFAKVANKIGKLYKKSRIFKYLLYLHIVYVFSLLTNMKAVSKFIIMIDKIFIGLIIFAIIVFLVIIALGLRKINSNVRQKSSENELKWANLKDGDYVKINGTIHLAKEGSFNRIRSNLKITIKNEDARIIRKYEEGLLNIPKKKGGTRQFLKVMKLKVKFLDPERMKKYLNDDQLKFFPVDEELVIKSVEFEGDIKVFDKELNDFYNDVDLFDD